MYQTFSFQHSVRKQWLAAFCIFQFPFFITHFLAACEPKTNICVAGGLPTDGNADLRMNSFAAGGFEMKTVNVSARKFDHGSRASCCRSRKCPRTFHPQFGFAIRGNFQTLALPLCGSAIRRLRPGVSADSTIGVLGFTKLGLSPIGNLFPDNS